MNKVAFFLPVRAGSQRVKNTDTKPFADVLALFGNKRIYS